MKTLTDALRTVPLIGILRGCPSRYLEGIASAAIEAGLATIELTMDSPDPAANIERLVASFPESVIGAGTVLNLTDVERAADSGARYVVSPVLDPAVVEATLERGLESIPGAATPSEISLAIRLGASMVKVFPAELLGGPRFVSSIVDLLGRPSLVPTGGIRAHNVSAYLEAGAVAVGVGSAAFPRQALERGEVNGIRESVGAFTEAVTT